MMSCIANEYRLIPAQRNALMNEKERLRQDELGRLPDGDGYASNVGSAKRGKMSGGMNGSKLHACYRMTD